ncbi:MAG: hypothetical protein V4591_08195 [Bdellovibrionota bacterium]
MYLASLYVCFDLDPSIPQTDKDRLLLSIREKLKQKFRNKLTAKIDEMENSIAVAFFEHNYEKLKTHLHHISEYLEASSGARISFQQEQIFSWFNGQFSEANQNKLFDLSEEKNKLTRSRQISAMAETIVYTNNEDEETMPIPSRFTRRNLRIPTRK